MSSLVSRYPGAQPFADDETSRLVFGGRDRDSQALLNLVLAHRLVVVYARSGLGKTSLLQAGLATRLRDEHHLPLLVRLNDVSRLPLVSLIENVDREAARQEVEYHARNTASLWHYFKTAEFWRGDLLLTPVLILDQFEEMFTLQDQQARAGFLRELGYLIRGVRPQHLDPSHEHGQPPLSDNPPNLRVLISLREDFLGLLEEAADNIPQILDHRFRLKPLGVDDAAEAVEKPAGIGDERFSTRPFRYGPGTIQAIVEYLARWPHEVPGITHRHVEPFHLQLICQRAEDIARQRQSKGVKDVTVTFDDLGGVPGLETTLRDFCSGVLRSIAPRKVRRNVQRLCTDYLISPEGRRLSMERGEIERILTLDAGTLQHLVNRRLLRSDQRTERWYFELSHDSLVEPILATSRLRGLTVGWVGLTASGLMGLIALASLLGGGLALGGQGAGAPTVLFVAAFVGLALWNAVFGVRQSVETLNRYLASPTRPSAQVRRRTVWTWLICAYAALTTFDLISRLIPVVRGVSSPAQGSVLLLLLLSIKTAAIVGGAITLLGFRARAVSLFAVSVVSTIAGMILGFPFYVEQYRAGLDSVSDAVVSVITVFASLIGVEVAILGYAWWLRKQRVLG